MPHTAVRGLLLTNFPSLPARIRNAIRVLLLTNFPSLPARVRNAYHVQWEQMRGMQTGAGGQGIWEGAVLTDLMSLPARNESAAGGSAARFPVYLAHILRAPVRIQDYEQCE
jgi:hypothetical protein